MKKGFLLAGLLFASVFAAVAEEHFYSVPLNGDPVKLDREITLPAVITGRVSSATSKHWVSFEVDRNYGELPAVIYTNEGTGAVFRATLAREEVGGAGSGILLSAERENWTFIPSTPYVLLISAATYKAGASYAVQLGNFDEFTVSFDGNGGTPSTNKMAYIPGRTYGEFPTARRTNYVHTGWSTSAKNGILLTTNTQVCVGYRKLYAQWKANPLSPTNDVPVVSPTNDVPAASSTNSMPATIYSHEVDGLVWHYTATSNGVATVHNVSGGAYVAAVDTSVKGTLTIPSRLGTNVVEKIGERAFAGCSSVTNIVIPFGVTSIGNCAFAGCTGLTPSITIPESVEEMGAYVFTNCPNLKIVRYLGNCPDADEALYAGAPASLISGVLRVRTGWPKDVTYQIGTSSSGDDALKDDDADVVGDGENDVDNDADDGEESTGVTYARWPEGSYSRRVLPWVTQPLFPVVFWAVPGVSSSATVWYYVPGRALGSLPQEPEDRDGYTFLGWFTKPYGGTKIEDGDADDIIVDRRLTFYAHWHRDDDPDNLADVEYNFATAHSYDGYLLNSDGDMAGTILLRTSKGRWSRAEEGTNVTATATLVLLGEGRIKLKGTLGEDLSGTLTATTKSDERELDVSLRGSDMDGTFGSYMVVGVRDISGKKTYLDRMKAKAVGDNWRGNYVVALKADSDESSLGNGYAGLSVQVRANGRARVSGTMPDGTKVSYSGRMEISDDSCALPVVAQLHRGRKGGFGFLLTFSGDSDVSLSALSNWSKPEVPFVASLTAEGAGWASDILDDSLTFSLEEAFDIEGIDDSLLPSDVAVTVSGVNWRTPKADSVKFVAEDSAYEVRTEYGNPSGLSLSVKSSEGMFRGRFKVFTVTEAGRSKKYSATVNGAILDGVGYGTATIRKIGAVPVTVRAE